METSVNGASCSSVVEWRLVSVEPCTQVWWSGGQWQCILVPRYDGEEASSSRVEVATPYSSDRRTCKSKASLSYNNSFGLKLVVA